MLLLLQRKYVEYQNLIMKVKKRHRLRGEVGALAIQQDVTLGHLHKFLQLLVTLTLKMMVIHTNQRHIDTELLTRVKQLCIHPWDQYLVTMSPALVGDLLLQKLLWCIADGSIKRGHCTKLGS